jgi:hypothetical protein
VLHERYREPRVPLLGAITQLLREREVESVSDLLELSGEVLRALARLGFRSVDHWEVRPGGWLPLPEPTHASLDEPVGHLLRALQSGAWATVADSHAFAVRLSGPPDRRVDLVVRRVHPERVHAVTLAFRGRLPAPYPDQVVRAIHSEVQLDRAEVTEAVGTRRARRAR